MKLRLEHDWEDEIEEMPGYLASMAAAGEEIAGLAKAIAPRGHEVRERYGGVTRPGDYARSIKVTFAADEKGEPRVYVAATDFKAHWIEWGTEDTPRFATLRRATKAKGLRLRELPKK